MMFFFFLFLKIKNEYVMRGLIRELEKCAQGVHGGVGFGTELLIQFSPARLIPFSSDQEDDASPLIFLPHSRRGQLRREKAGS